MRFLLLVALSLPLAAASPPTLLDILNDELQRNFSVLKQKADPPPYYMSYTVTENESQVLTASLGSLTGKGKLHLRYLDITIRVGTPKLDNYHVVNGQRARFTTGAILPLDDVPDAIRQKVWLETDRTYRLAARRLIEIKSNAQSKVKQEDDSDDFSIESPSVHQEPPPVPHYPDEQWSRNLRKWSALLSNTTGILNSSIVLAVERQTKYMVSTEGTRLLHGRTFTNISIGARGKAEDGMDLSAMQDFQSADLTRLPKPEVIEAAVNRVGTDLSKLAAGSHRGAVRRPGDSVRPRRRRLLPRDFRPSRRGPPPERRDRGPDLHQSRRNAGAAGFPLGGLRSDSQSVSSPPI